jgi:hypothetical protein
MISLVLVAYPVDDFDPTPAFTDHQYASVLSLISKISLARSIARDERRRRREELVMTNDALIEKMLLLSSSQYP